MYFQKRKLVKIIGFSIISTFLFPLEFLKASSKKIINQNLTNKQKEIMFNECTEKTFSSDLLKENREGFYHCANCGPNTPLLLNLIGCWIASLESLQGF